MTTKPPPAVISVEVGTHMGDLIAAYAELKPRVDDLTARLKALSDAIKLEATGAAQGAQSIDLQHATGSLRVSYVERWDLDAKRMKAEDPETYVRWARKGGSWQLRGVAG